MWLCEIAQTNGSSLTIHVSIIHPCQTGWRSSAIIGFCQVVSFFTFLVSKAILDLKIHNGISHVLFVIMEVYTKWKRLLFLTPTASHDLEITAEMVGFFFIV